MSDFLATPKFPYCKGCGHHLIARSTARALEALQLHPLDAVLVTDIGCHGIADRAFATHTVHGLHGRSVALGAGIAMDLPVGKKVVVFIGDGGATIGLQHLLEAARLNVDVTVIVHNNMLYGMTGGQPSGLTPCGFRTVITPDGSAFPAHHLCQLVRDAGAPYARRVLGRGDFSDAIREALEVEGFALVEVLELCPSHGAKMNPDLRLPDLTYQAGCELGLWTSESRPPLRLTRRESALSLLEMEGVEARFTSPLSPGERMAVVLGGSAGEGVQLAAELLARAAMASGLAVTKKGSYPVTVGVGFSTAEVILARDPIEYHGVAQPDAVVVTSEDGLRHNLARIEGLRGGVVWLDASLTVPRTRAEVRVRDFRERAGPRSAAIYGTLTFVWETGVIPAQAFVEAVRESRVGQKVPAELLETSTPA